jgi:hypothetical protein
VVGTTVDTTSSNTLYGKTLAIRADIAALDVTKKWGTYSAADIIGYLDTLEIKLGTNADISTAPTVFGKLALMNSYVDSLEGLVGQATDTSTANTLFGKIAGISAGGVEVSTAKLEALIGAATDAATASTLFGKVANVANLCAGISTAQTFAQNAYKEAVDIRKELGAEGKTQTAYDAIVKLENNINALKTAVEKITTAGIDTDTLAATIVNALAGTTKQAASAAGYPQVAEGLTGVSVAQAQDLSAIQNKLIEIENTLNLILEAVTKKDEQPVVTTWYGL